MSLRLNLSPRCFFSLKGSALMKVLETECCVIYKCNNSPWAAS
jgi:hypothetical protein